MDYLTLACCLLAFLVATAAVTARTLRNNGLGPFLPIVVINNHGRRYPRRTDTTSGSQRIGVPAWAYVHTGVSSVLIGRDYITGVPRVPPSDGGALGLFVNPDVEPNPLVAIVTFVWRCLSASFFDGVNIAGTVLAVVSSLATRMFGQGTYLSIPSMQDDALMLAAPRMRTLPELDDVDTVLLPGGGLHPYNSPHQGADNASRGHESVHGLYNNTPRPAQTLAGEGGSVIQ